MKSLIKAWILTAHCCGCCIGFSYLWIHINQHILINCYSMITFLNLLFNPCSKRILDDRIHHIDQPLLWNFLDFLSVRKIFNNIYMLFDNCNHVINLKTVVLWYSKMLNTIRFNNYMNNSYLKIMSCLHTFFSSTD